MKMITKLTLTLIFIGLNAFSARVAVTDSGTDFSHEWLNSRMLINTKEIAGNRVDDDRNGKVDDVYGWNFADNYGRVFFKEHVSSVDPKVYKIIDVLARVQSGTQTPEDDTYWKETVLSMNTDQKKALVTELNFFGQYAHSTHVSGIIASVAPDSKLISNRVFPDAPLAFVPMAGEAKESRKGMIDWAYRLLAMLSNGAFEKVADYIAERQIDVANYSLGTSLQMIATVSLNARGNKTPTKEQIAAETVRLYKQYEPIGQKWMKAASNTLFVVAAGNEGSNNDVMPMFPANVAIENNISVGASLGVNSIATFSNYGIKSVDVFAPGVAIKSSVPSEDNKSVLAMSGTSMAAPYVAGVAARIKDINPKLTPAQMKQILMGTVDKKDWLKTKAVTSGVVNPERAYDASARSQEMSVEDAITASLQNVADQKEATGPKRLFQSSTPVTRDMQQMAKEIIF